jgi:putative ABC transport system permease protein
LRYLRFFGPNIEADVSDELAFHLEMRIKDYQSRGMTRQEAELAARSRLGDLDDVSQTLTQHDYAKHRSASRREVMGRIQQDLRIALRGFRRTPAFFLSAVVILGLGIGMSVAMVTVFRAVTRRKGSKPCSARHS